MSKKAKLATAMATNQIVRVYRDGLEDGWIDGYVVSMGDDFFALRLINSEMRFDGYVCLRRSDITACEVPAPYADFKKKALKARGLGRPAHPELDLWSVAALLCSAGKLFPLVTIHLDRADPGVCYIGAVVSVGRERLTLLKIRPDAEWDAEPSSLKLKKITRVDFGGGYEDALLLVGGKAPPHGRGGALP